MTCALCGFRDATAIARIDGRAYACCAACDTAPAKPRRTAWDGPRAEYQAGPRREGRAR